MLRKLFVLSLLPTVGMFASSASAAQLKVQFPDGSPVTGLTACVGDSPSCQNAVVDKNGVLSIALGIASKVTWRRSAYTAGVPAQNAGGTVWFSDPNQSLTVTVDHVLEGSSPEIDSSEAQLLDMINVERRKLGRPDLVADPTLSKAADYQTTWLNQTYPGENFSAAMHDGIYNTSSAFRAGEASYAYPAMLAETAQWNQKSFDNNEVIQAFKNSKAHWDILMSADYKPVGVSKTRYFVIVNPALNYTEPVYDQTPTTDQISTSLVANVQDDNSALKPTVRKPKHQGKSQNPAQCSLTSESKNKWIKYTLEGNCIKGGKLSVVNKNKKTLLVKHANKQKRSWKIPQKATLYVFYIKKSSKHTKIVVKGKKKKLTW